MLIFSLSSRPHINWLSFPCIKLQSDKCNLMLINLFNLVFFNFHHFIPFIFVFFFCEIVIFIFHLNLFTFWWKKDSGWSKIHMEKIFIVNCFFFDRISSLPIDNVELCLGTVSSRWFDVVNRIKGEFRVTYSLIVNFHLLLQ